MKLFGVDIANLIKQNVGPGALPATLTKVTMGGYNPTDPASGRTQTTTSYPCRVIVTRLDFGEYTNELVRNLQGEILVILGTLPAGIVPVSGDSISVVPPGYATSKSFVVTADPPNKKAVVVDPAGATAVCQVDGTP